MKDFIYNPPLNPYLNVLLRDHSVIAINKPSGLLSVPGRLQEHNDSVLSRIRTFCPEAYAVHRLDMDTSGIIIYALNKQAVRALGKQFEQRTTRKIYVCEVAGHIEGCGRIDAPMRCDWENRPRQIIDYTQGKKALTFYRSLKATEQSSLLLLKPYTGRSHQLRLHTAFLGHPILGDRFYADAISATASPYLRLHAVALAFTHPDSLDEIKLVSVPEFATQYLDSNVLMHMLDEEYI